MKITWFGHACFGLESEGYRVLLDPYTRVRGHEELCVAAHKTLCSHEHFDHNAREHIAMPLIERPCPFAIEALDTYHDDQGGAKRGRNTVHILRAEGVTAVHLGDLGHLLTEEQAQRIYGCDVLMIPVGGTYTIDAREAKTVVEQVRPRMVIPMHYRHGKYGFTELDTVETFTGLFPARCVRRCPGRELEITAETPAETEGVICVFDGAF